MDGPVRIVPYASLIRMLYDIEDQIRDLDDAQQFGHRQSLSRHVLDLTDECPSSEAMSVSSVLPKSNLGLTICMAPLTLCPV